MKDGGQTNGRRVQNEEATSQTTNRRGKNVRNNASNQRSDVSSSEGRARNKPTKAGEVGRSFEINAKD